MTGKRIAHFAIAGKLGEGGMGVVYEAIDANLDRRVAIKILPPEKVADAARKARFIQEAKAASALNHPNIITIYEIGSEDGLDYIAMELVSGRTLEDLLAKRRLKTAETLKIAVQIADAVAAAHAAGIMHRDLKPANVMIADSGLVKVLDFGLAKLTEQTDVSEDDATRTQRAVTEDGAVVGSAAYMSPEQAEGKKVDARSDIFSFGVVLYEMLSGKRAFQGESRMKTMAAVLNQEPAPLAEAVPGVPKELERIVRRCLRKDLARRSQSMAEIKIALEELKEESESGVSPYTAPMKKAGAPWRWVAVGAAAAALVAAAWNLAPRWSVRPGALKEVPLTSYPGYQGEPALSPAGDQFGFVWDGGEDTAPPQLYVSLAGRGTPLKLTNTPGTAAAGAAWSPDGQSIAFVRETPGDAPNDLIVIPALGGPERKVDQGMSGSRLAWSPDGKWLYFSALLSPRRRALFVDPWGGGDRRKLTDPPPGGNGDRVPSVSPSGRQMVFIRSFADYNEDLFVADLRDGITAGVPRRITNDHQVKSSPVWTTDGKEIVYVAGEETSLLAMYRVPASGGTPARIEGIGDHAVDLAIAPKGHRLVYSRSLRDWDIWRMPLPAARVPSGRGAPTKFLSSTRYEVSPAYSPDGMRIAFSSNRGGVRQIWVADADGSNSVALTNFTGGDSRQSEVVAGWPEHRVRCASGGSRRCLFHPSRRRHAQAAHRSPCGKSSPLLFPRWPLDLLRFPAPRPTATLSHAGKRREPVQITHKGAFAPMASPDGKWVYYSKNGGIWKVPADGGEETPVLPDHSLYDVFGFYVTASGIYFAPSPNTASGRWPLKLYRFADGQTVELGHFDHAPNLHISVSPDEKWLLYTQLDSSVDDLMLVENFR